MGEVILDEGFDGARPDRRLRWHHRPSRWSIGESQLVVYPDAGTDFWQRTHYGFRADTGHMLGLRVTGDFVVSTKVRFFPLHQYDQAGLMLRYSSQCWLKTSVEYESDGPCRLGVVVTRGGYSDWSTQDFPVDRGELGLRVRKKGDDFTVEYLQPGVLDTTLKASAWTQIRVAHMGPPSGSALRAGVYACSPKGAGFRADFGFLLVEAT